VPAAEFVPSLNQPRWSRQHFAGGRGCLLAQHRHSQSLLLQSQRAAAVLQPPAQTFRPTSVAPEHAGRVCARAIEAAHLIFSFYVCFSLRRRRAELQQNQLLGSNQF